MIAENKDKKLHANEGIKTRSNFLRGTILEGLADESTGALSDDDCQLTKFHGFYMQDDRDIRAERRKKKLDKAYSFMIRLRMPGGVCTPKQWLALDEIADTYANGTIRLTTRQTIQYHGVIKTALKPTMKAINATLLDTIAACGDVNRNVLSCSLPEKSEAHAVAFKLAKEVSDHLLPRTRAYHEIWLDGEKVESTEEEIEPLYGKTYLPRKFKVVVAVPPSNDVDIFAHDLGYIAILDKTGKVTGYNVTVGGGMGMTHGVKETYPRVADVLGFCTPEQAVDVGEKVMLVQRDYGDREDRKHARLKYTIEDRGIDWFRKEVEKRLGYKLQKPKAYKFTHTGDNYGWQEGSDGKWYCTLFVQNGRIKDTEGYQLKTALRELAQIHKGDFRLTANQNFIIAGVSKSNKGKIDKLLADYHVFENQARSGLRRNSMACVALPTCGLALAESERYLPSLIDKLEDLLDETGLREEDIVIRMTGCPNGCARPYLAEIGFVGKAPGKYNLYLGAAFNGSRLNKLYKENVTEELAIEALKPLIRSYADGRKKGERFGDFVIRRGYVRATEKGPDFHDNLGDL